MPNPAFGSDDASSTAGPAGGATTGATSTTSAATTSSTTASSPTGAPEVTSEAAGATGVDETTGTTGGTTDDGTTGTTGDGSTGSTSEGDELASTGPQDGAVVVKASKTYDPTMFYPGDLALTPARTLLLPPALQVTVGNAGNHAATLRAELTDASAVTCTYRGGSSQANPQPNTNEWQDGLEYLLEVCDDGSQAGAMLDVEALHLAIENGASMQPPGAPQTTAIAVLPEV